MYGFPPPSHSQVLDARKQADGCGQPPQHVGVQVQARQALQLTDLGAHLRQLVLRHIPAQVQGLPGGGPR